MTTQHRVSLLSDLGLFWLKPMCRDGTCVRDYLHIMDLASGHVLALGALSPESKIFNEDAPAYFKAYNLGKGKGVSVLQIVEAMRKATGFDYKYEIIGRRCALQACSSLDLSDMICQAWRRSGSHCRLFPR